MATYRRLLVVNGANLNLLGVREPEIYGATTLQDIENRLTQTANTHDIELIFVQSNFEGELIDAIQQHGLLGEDDKLVDGVIINPAGFTHTSVVLRDALLAINKPFIEVHLSNIHRREPFRSHSYFSDRAIGMICGLGHLGYDMALDYFFAPVFIGKRGKLSGNLKQTVYETGGHDCWHCRQSAKNSLDIYRAMKLLVKRHGLKCSLTWGYKLPTPWVR